MAKITMKEKVLQFVESKGSASFTEIQEFIVDTKMGQGAYQEKRSEPVWDFKQKKKVERLRRVYRGYYCGAFSGPSPYFLLGADRLKKGNFDGKYRVVRNG